MKKILIVITLLLIFGTMAHANMHAYPVPFNNADPAHRANGGVTFTNIPGAGTLQIYDVVGQEVKQINVAPGQLERVWDVTNNSGKQVATGVYFWIYKYGSQAIKSKLVVIR